MGKGRRTGRTTRYRSVIRGGRRGIVCTATHNIVLHVELGLSVDDETRKGYPPRCIFLDGVFSGPPFLDNKMQHYSLDHHTGCIRAITMATCEQAVSMLLSGLPLQEGDWRVYVNDPDADAILAAWVLLNHAVLLGDDQRLLWNAMPLIRTEAVIDAHGLDRGVLTGLSEAMYDRQKQTLDDIMQVEREMKASGEWSAADLLTYVRDVLGDLDRHFSVVAPSPDPEDLEVVSNVVVHGGKLAFLCRSSQGIYEVELLLKEKDGKLVALIVLDRGGGRFTLRQVDPFLEKDLDTLYDALNEADPRVDQVADPGNVWGGASDIGGSPRRTGSGLGGEEILAILGRVFS